MVVFSYFPNYADHPPPLPKYTNVVDKVNIPYLGKVFRGYGRSHKLPDIVLQGFPIRLS